MEFKANRQYTIEIPREDLKQYCSNKTHLL